MKSSNEAVASLPNADRILVVMAKAPRPGRVKTRLAQSLPTLAVTDLYRCLLVDTVTLARTFKGVEVAIMCPPPDLEDLSRTGFDAVRVVAQSGDGLAAGLTSVFAHFATADRRRIIAFNSDSPHLPASVLESAFEALATHDLVVGPTHDGGYYLVGATASHPGLFTGDGMGTTNAFQALLKHAQALRLSVRLTDPFYDIDEITDLRRLAAELQRVPARAPRTAEWFQQWWNAVPQAARSGGHR